MTPHQRIKRAALAGKGCRLTARECWELYHGDDAIRACADNDDEEDLLRLEDSSPNKEVQK